MWCAVLTLVSATLHVADHRTDTRDRVEEQSDGLCDSEFLESQREVRLPWSKTERCVELCAEDSRVWGA